MDVTEHIGKLLNTVYFEKGGDKGTVSDMKLGKHEKVSADKALTTAIKEEEIIKILAKAKEIFLSQPASVDIGVPVKICGDIHGQFSDLLRIFAKGGFPPLTNYLFLGDYVDRGKQNIETILLLTCYKVKYPKNVFLLRGNHECGNVNSVYGFLDECMRRYKSQKLWLAFQDMFDVMPLSAVVGRRILCMHGGISPHAKNLADLKKIKRPTDATGDTLEMDLLWSDPVAGLSGFQANQRGASYGFGEDVLAKFLKENDLDMVARAHQVVQDGYEFFAGRKLVTVFSAPYYCGQFENAAAILSVDAKLLCSFEILRPMHRFARVESKTSTLVAPTDTKEPETKNDSKFEKKPEKQENKNNEKKVENKPPVEIKNEKKTENKGNENKNEKKMDCRTLESRNDKNKDQKKGRTAPSVANGGKK